MTPDTDATKLPDVFAYLLGEGELDGKSFGEGPPEGQPRHWWRYALKRELDAQAGRTEAVGVREALANLVDQFRVAHLDMGGNHRYRLENDSAAVAKAVHAAYAALAQPTAMVPAILGGPLLCPHGKPSPMHGPYMMPCRCEPAQPEPTGADAVEAIVAAAVDQMESHEVNARECARVAIAALRAIGWGP